MEPEDGLPTDMVYQESAQHWSEASGYTTDRRPNGDRLGALMTFEHVGDNRQRRREHESGANALKSSHYDQHGSVGRQGRADGCASEYDRAESEELPAAEAVPRGPAYQQKPGDEQ